MAHLSDNKIACLYFLHFFDLNSGENQLTENKKTIITSPRNTVDVGVRDAHVVCYKKSLSYSRGYRRLRNLFIQTDKFGEHCPLSSYGNMARIEYI